MTRAFAADAAHPWLSSAPRAVPRTRPPRDLLGMRQQAGWPPDHAIGASRRARFGGAPPPQRDVLRPGGLDRTLRAARPRGFRQSDPRLSGPGRRDHRAVRRLRRPLSWATASLSYFGWPKASETDAEQRDPRGAARRRGGRGSPVPGEALRVRIGIATGLVVVGERVEMGDGHEPTAIGETPNRAARLQTLASAGRDRDRCRHAPPGRRTCSTSANAARCPSRVCRRSSRYSKCSREANGPSRFEALHAAAARMPLIGRQEELELLLRRWRRREAARPGRAGLGRGWHRQVALLAALEDRLLRTGTLHPAALLLLAATIEDTPLHPVIEQFDYSAGFARDDTPGLSWRSCETALAPHRSADRGCGTSRRRSCRFRPIDRCRHSISVRSGTRNARSQP